MNTHSLKGQAQVLDDSSWRKEHAALCTFLDLWGWEPSGIAALFERTAAMRAALLTQNCAG